MKTKEFLEEEFQILATKKQLDYLNLLLDNKFKKVIPEELFRLKDLIGKIFISKETASKAISKLIEIQQKYKITYQKNLKKEINSLSIQKMETLKELNLKEKEKKKLEEEIKKLKEIKNSLKEGEEIKVNKSYGRKILGLIEGEKNGKSRKQRNKSY